jgi:RNA polymerase sigma-70 factor, ECF subfamily
MLQRLTLRFLAGGGPAFAPEPALEAWLGEMLAAGRSAWPELGVSDEAFVDHLAGLSYAGDGPAPMEGLRADDLMLACACRLGEPQAIQAFVRRHDDMLRAVFARPSASGVDAADLQQQLLQRLFVGGAGKRPKIWDYGGRGSLAGWLKVAALRLRIDSERRVSDKVDPLMDAQAELPLDGIAEDPELKLLKHDYRAVFRSVFTAALAELTPRERNLLRQSIVHGLSATQIAQLNGIHRSTAKRWLADIREGLLARTRDGLVASLGIDHSEFQSIMNLIQSRLDVSICSHLKEQ